MSVEFKLDSSHPHHRTGQFYGYPECCIRSFPATKRVDKLNIMFGTGYIPCVECQKKSPEELLAYINEHRICKTPFPVIEAADSIKRQMFLIKMLNKGYLDKMLNGPNS